MKTVVVTGSTRGIGYGLAQEFLKRGCNVVVTGRSQASVDKAVTLLNGGERLWDPLESTCRHASLSIL